MRCVQGEPNPLLKLAVPRSARTRKISFKDESGDRRRAEAASKQRESQVFSAFKYTNYTFYTIYTIYDISSLRVYSVKYSARWVENVFFPTLNYEYVLLQH